MIDLDKLLEALQITGSKESCNGCWHQSRNWLQCVDDIPLGEVCKVIFEQPIVRERNVMRLIDLDYALEDMCRDADYASDYTDRWLEELPRVDAVPVIRCKECRYWQDNNGGYPNKDCKWREDETPDADDWCSGAERKEE